MARNQVHGIVVTPGAISYTTLEEKQERWTVVETRTVDLCDGLPTLLLEQDAFADALRSHTAAWPGRCTLALPASFGLLRIVELPSVEEEEIESMVELQVDKFSPYPVEQLQVSYETLGRTDRTTRVVVVAVLRERIDALGESCRELGLRVDRLDVDILGWWNSIRQAGEVARNGRSVMVICELNDAILVVTESGLPVLIRSLGPQGDAPRDEYCGMIAEETEYALTAVETEWGSTAALGCRVWYRDLEPTDLAVVLEKECGFPVTTHTLDDLKPLSESIVDRTTEGPDERVDLAPPSWEISYRSKVTQRNFLVATGATLIVWLVVVSGFLLALGIQRSGLKDLQARFESLEEPANEVRTIKRNAQFLGVYTNRNNSALETLLSVVRAMPDEVELSHFEFKSGGKVSFAGRSGSEEGIDAFDQNLQTMVGTIEQVKLGFTTSDKKDRRKRRFSFTAMSREEISKFREDYE